MRGGAVLMLRRVRAALDRLRRQFRGEDADRRVDMVEVGDHAP